jgi:DNA-binding CsgD family transcriptional regulator
VPRPYDPVVGVAEGAGPDAGATRLLERERELLLLDREIANTLAGGAGLVLVEGPAGIGKSRILAEARRRGGENRLAVLSARGSELERDFPFGVVRQLFEPQLIDPGVRSRVLAGAAGATSAIFGSVDAPPDPAADAVATGASAFAALHALYWLTVNLSGESPLLIAVDDLHWCDRPSLRFLGYLARRLEGIPVLVVVSLRPSEPGADGALVAELTGDPIGQRLVPRPLSASAAEDLVRDRLGTVDRAFADACHASTHGNPLLLAELMKALAAEGVTPDAAHVDVVAELGPRAVSRAVLLRLARLSPDAVSLARSIAVLGDAAETAVVRAHAGLDAEALAAASRELVKAEIVHPEPPLGFVHPLVQAAVYRDLAPGERDLSHERAARILLEHDAPVERVAAQILAFPRRGEDWVVATLRSAARIAFGQGAPDAAIATLKRALLEPLDAEVRNGLLFDLGKAQALMYLPDAVEALRGAYASAPNPTIRGEAADWLACSLMFLDAADEGAAIVHQTRLELPPDHDELRRLLESGELISLFFGGPTDDGERLERLRSHRTIDPGLGPAAKMLAAVAAWEWAESTGPVDDVVALAHAALEDGTLITADAPERTAGAILALALADLDEATDRWDAVRAEAHRTGFVYTMLAVQQWNGYTQFLRGELGDAETELRAALSTAAQWGVPAQQPWAAAVLAELLVERGAVAEARSLLSATPSAHPGSDPATLLARAHMRVLLAEGRADDARLHADEFREHAAWRSHPRYVPWRSLKAQALDRLGRQRDALDLALEELQFARTWGSPGTVGRSLRVLGTIERDDGLDHLQEACALLESAPARLERAKALAALGETLRRARRPTEAREPLRMALEQAEIAGATALVDRTRAEIYATGARPRSSALHGIGSLTASERRVADLAAGGRSNRDIAQSLYVTPKTVEVHLSAAYRKLGIGSRRELSQALAGP